MKIAEYMAKDVLWLERLSELGGWSVDYAPVSVTGLPIRNSVEVTFSEPVSVERADSFDYVMDKLRTSTVYLLQATWKAASGDLAFPEPANSVLLTWI